MGHYTRLMHYIINISLSRHRDFLDVDGTINVFET